MLLYIVYQTVTVPSQQIVRHKMCKPVNNIDHEPSGVFLTELKR